MSGGLGGLGGPVFKVLIIFKKLKLYFLYLQSQNYVPQVPPIFLNIKYIKEKVAFLRFFVYSIKKSKKP